MSERVENRRKRTRSEKGQAYDEMLLEAKSPKAKESKQERKKLNGKSKVSRRIESMMKLMLENTNR